MVVQKKKTTRSRKAAPVVSDVAPTTIESYIDTRQAALDALDAMAKLCAERGWVERKKRATEAKRMIDA